MGKSAHQISPRTITNPHAVEKHTVRQRSQDQVLKIVRDRLDLVDREWFGDCVCEGRLQSHQYRDRSVRYQAVEPMLRLLFGWLLGEGLQVSSFYIENRIMPIMTHSHGRSADFGQGRSGTVENNYEGDWLTQLREDATSLLFGIILSFIKYYVISVIGSQYVYATIKVF